ncbi:antigen-presenting glycoprotein CD1d-like isoform X2 [Lepidochelys kempii]
MEGMALLGDLETHSMDCSTCQIRFLQPWAQRGLTPKEWQDLELLIHHYLFNFNRTVNRIAQQQGMAYPFVTQVSVSCEFHPNGTSRGFYEAAVNGEDFVSFDADAGTWVARQGDKLALYTRDLLNHERSTAITLQFLLRATCINELKSFVQYGNESLERQERPVAVVFARAPSPAGTPAPLLLVCRVTGFYPRPIRVAWLQDGEEVGPDGRLSSSGILPNADLTYQLRSSLAMEPGDGHSYACRVEHSSLGGQSLLIPWGATRTLDQGSPGPEGGTGPGVGIDPSPGDMDLGAGSVPSSRAEGPKGRTGSGCHGVWGSPGPAPLFLGFTVTLSQPVKWKVYWTPGTNRAVGTTRTPQSSPSGGAGSLDPSPGVPCVPPPSPKLKLNPPSRPPPAASVHIVGQRGYLLHPPPGSGDRLSGLRSPGKLPCYIPRSTLPPPCCVTGSKWVAHGT